ncbi:hypothetical protein PABG_11315 [Paracoccidioides brasiliensis Pb03]|uniref:Uncharacterized protein n=2 Tax=Paracoccidioides brasiliensis TaxID=121759 RepID=A0A0A0HVR0_PARBD|nr:uncharacterized protein PADG_11667 [Paracoccidioides brasiliensis Pb18]KGM92131.1 hypothetical protein PADG_11667 [Paracoccidioides brasiliensis Pb18]KGY15662.1 hypothetical protein PABG_11315 [Paracoccidioides brasiliensis Pb03]ODH39447.1 hypothetical protein ACO22_01904 [Paracoccidioides brasiliensis]ODH47446.1 hypothetical protein GX48_06482 [Paracoccidioides brasiliensis]
MALRPIFKEKSNNPQQYFKPNIPSLCLKGEAHQTPTVVDPCGTWTPQSLPISVHSWPVTGPTSANNKGSLG